MRALEMSDGLNSGVVGLHVGWRGVGIDRAHICIFSDDFVLCRNLTRAFQEKVVILHKLQRSSSHVTRRCTRSCRCIQ